MAWGVLVTLRSIVKDVKEEQRRRNAAKWLVRMRGPLAADHAAEFERWLGVNPQNILTYNRLAQRWDGAAILRNSHISSSIRRPMTLWRPLGAALVGAGLILVIALPLSKSDPWREQWAKLTPIRTRIGEIRTVRLSDGSTVILDTDSALAVNITPSVRHLVLQKGRARFDVRHDPRHPFRVVAGDGVVVARGTMFDIALTARDQVAVTLVRGAVDIEGDAAKSPMPVARMTPGQKAAFGPKIDHLALKPVVISEETWPQGVLTFDRAPLRDVLAAANRYTVRQIELGQDVAGDVAVTGVFHAGDADRLARTLAATLDLQLHESEQGPLILHRNATRVSPS